MAFFDVDPCARRSPVLPAVPYGSLVVFAVPSQDMVMIPLVSAFPIDRRGGQIPGIRVENREKFLRPGVKRVRPGNKNHGNRS